VSSRRRSVIFLSYILINGCSKFRLIIKGYARIELDFMKAIADGKLTGFVSAETLRLQLYRLFDAYFF
tara:strand:+ start:1838 stop:2041 length:204 start_codon:yes stop_codon:yes gene_type:complete